MSLGFSRTIATLVVLTALCACTKAFQSGAGTASDASIAPKTHSLRVADGSGDIPTLNPHLYTEQTVGYIGQLSQAYLVKYDQHNRPFAELVTVVPTQANGGISKDGSTITWHLRKGLRWSDGAPFTADDVVFSTNVVLNPANNEASRDGWNLITKVDEPDKYTVVYHLKHPYASYEPTFFGTAGANPSVLPKHLLANVPNINAIPYNANPVGIGPFRVTQWRRSEAVELEANPYYFRGEPKIKHIEFKLLASRETLITQLQTGEVDLWPAVTAAYIASVASITKLKSDIRPSPYYAHLDFNVSHPLVSDLRVRQAIRYAIDRKALADKITRGNSIIQESVVPPVNPIAPTLADVPLVPYDQDKAKALLDAAGWKVGSDGIRVKHGQRLSLSFPYYTGSQAADNTVEFLRSALKDVGIEIQTRQYSPAVYFLQPSGVIYSGKFDVTMFNWQADPVGDISNLWECDQISPRGQNITHYCNAKLDALLEQFNRSYDDDTHRKILVREAKIIADDVPTIVLYVLDTAVTSNRNLTDYNPGAWTAFDQMQDVDI